MIGLRPRAAACAFMLLVASGSPAWAGAPTEALRHSMDGIFALLDDPAFKGVDRAMARQRELFALADRGVDFSEAARRTLGATWEDRTPAERAHFVRLFADLIAHAYLKHIAHRGVRIAYDEEIWTGKDVIVRARAFRSSGDATPVAFAMREGDDGQWRLFDVSFGGMSLVGTYRAQFMRVIGTGSYYDLVKRLEMKTDTDTDALRRNAP
jgi:phospholipid transport system substrate-binding protein